MPTPTAQSVARIEGRAEDLKNQIETYLLECRRDTGEELDDVQAAKYRAMRADLRTLERRAEFERGELARVGSLPGNLAAAAGGSSDTGYGRAWAQQVAEKCHRAMGGGMEQRVVVSGSLDIPQLVEVDVIPMARPQRLIDLFPNRAALEGNSFEYYQQTARTNTATAVPDGGVKPTSTLTVTPHTDRCRVIAHLSEPVPLRLWYDFESFVSWLQSEMVAGVLDGLEHQIVSGDGTGENMLGLLNTPGTTQVSFNTDAVTTLRGALTALQVKGETPTGWVLHPADAEAVDLLRWGASGGFLSEGYETGVTPGDYPSSNNIFGTGLKRVVTPSVPVGTGILGDFTKLRVYVRQDAHLDIDASGDLFTKNQFIARGEGRYGIGVLRPSAFAICDLTAGTTTRSTAKK
jgi:HK97 family phage major capsid protein